MFRKIIFLIVLIELGIILLLFMSISLKRSRLQLSIDKLNKNYIVYSSASTLKYFYEPKANILETDQNTWLSPSVVQYYINDDTLNAANNYAVQKPHGVFRIIALGDSFTFGQNVSTSENWVKILEDLLNKSMDNKKISCMNINKFEVINLGVRGYDLQYEIERYKRRGIKYNPDLILWFLKNSEFERIEDLVIPIRTKLVKQLKVEGKYKKDFENTYDGYLLTFHQFNKQFDTTKLLDFQEESLHKFKRNYPNKIFVFNYVQFDNRYKTLLNKLKDDRFLWTEDITGQWDHKKYTFAPYDYHPNQRGYKLIADSLFNYLTKNKIIPCE